MLFLHRRAYQVPHFVSQIMVFLSEYKNLTLVKLTSNAGIVVENGGFLCILMPFREVKCSLLCLMKAMIWLVPCG